MNVFEESHQDPPRRALWLTARADPITGLVCFPDFVAGLPELIELATKTRAGLSLMIGDVDGLKGYVEEQKVQDVQLYGHIAGCHFMASLGRLTREWFERWNPEAGCAATFGGDEVILAGLSPDHADFGDRAAELHGIYGAELARTVSLVYVSLDTEHIMPDRRGSLNATQILQSLDRALFSAKKDRPVDGSILQGYRLNSNGAAGAAFYTLEQNA